MRALTPRPIGFTARRRTPGVRSGGGGTIRIMSVPGDEGAAPAQPRPVPVDGTTVWCRSPRWAHRAAADQVVLAAAGGARRTLEGQAAAVWVVLAEPGTVGQVVDRIRRWWPDPAITQRNGTDVDQVEQGDQIADLAVTIGMLADAEIIEVVGRSSP